MKRKIFNSFSFFAAILAVAIGVAEARAAATVVILNNDSPGVGFNDNTPVAPVGGNSGTTLGQQRLNAFQAAANAWGAKLNSNITISILSSWAALPCDAETAALGSAGAINIFRDFSGAPFTNTWYPEALANKIANADLGANPELTATFNVNLGKPGCFTGTFFYLGLDGNHGTDVDLVTVLQHEFAHGLGFNTYTSATDGSFNTGIPTAFDHFLVDDNTGKSWLQMTNAERAASARSVNQLAFNGPQVTSNVPNVLGGPVVRVNSPAGIAGNYNGIPALFGARLTSNGVTGAVVQATDPADGNGASTLDACSALTNAAAVAGKIALTDRGNCNFVTKAKNAQNAGAIGVIVVDTTNSLPTAMSGVDNTITIPVEMVSGATGTAIKGQLGAGVNATLRFDPSVLAGFDAFNKALLYAPNPVEGVSSVNHLATEAFPNQLMESFINPDVTHELAPPFDLALPALNDVGWLPATLPNTILKSSGDGQNIQINENAGTTISVNTTPIAAGLTVTWTVNQGANGASATFTGNSTRFATSLTNSAGVATAPTLRANGTAGPYTLTAAVPGAGSTSFSLVNSAVVLATPTPTGTPTGTPTPSPTPACTPAQRIVDGGFEATDDNGNNPNWASTSTAFGTSLCTPNGCGVFASAAPRTGNGWLWFDGAGGSTEAGSASQVVTFPDRGSAVLTYYLRIGQISNPATTVMRVMVDGNTVQTVNEPTAAQSAYTQRSVDLTAYADGGTHTVRFDYNRPNSGTENWTIDDVALNTTCNNPPVSRADFDRDGRTDISIFRPSDGTWWVSRSTLGVSVRQFAATGDTPVPGDYDGDGRADVAVFRPTAAADVPDYFVLNSSTSTVTAVSWGIPNDVPVIGDFNGDSRTDYAVFRPSTGIWHIEYSSAGVAINSFGQNGDVPMAMDTNGNGVSQIAVYRPSEGRWYIAREVPNPGQNYDVVNYGAPADRPVPADYDGDGKDDVAVFRPSNGTWYIIRSSNGSQRIEAFGLSADIPVPGDYDADGTDDIAIYRSGTWYLNRSTAGITALVFGTGNDIPLPARYIP